MRGDALIIILIVLLVGGIAAAMILAERRRRREMEELFASLRATFAFTKEDAAKAMAFLPFAGLLGVLKTGAKGVNWSASLAQSGFTVHTLEHSYTTGSGKNRSTHYHTVVASKAPREWAQLTVTREHLFTKIGKALGMKDVDLENPEFNKRWRVATEDENFALAALSVGVQEMLAHPSIGDMGEAWRFGNGLVAVTVGKRLQPRHVGVLIQRFGAFVDALEPELREQMGGEQQGCEAHQMSEEFPG